MSPVSHNAMDALEQSRKTLGRNASSKTSATSVFTIILFAFIIVTLLLAVLMGTRIYQSLNNLRTDLEDNRVSLSLLINSVRANDNIDSIAVGEGPEGRSLVLLQRLPSGTYETRIYQYDGYIVQEYALETQGYTPERADRVVQSDIFDFGYSNGLLTLITEQGTADIDIRSVREGS